MENIVDLRNQSSWLEDMVNYLTACNRGLAEDVKRLTIENELLKRQARESLVLHERKVVCTERKIRFHRL